MCEILLLRLVLKLRAQAFSVVLVILVDKGCKGIGKHVFVYEEQT